MNPGQHGIFHFTNPVRRSYRFAQIDARARRMPTIWRILSEPGTRVAALNLSVFHPAEHVEGIMIAGWLCPSLASNGFTYSPELAGFLKEHSGDYPIHPDVRRHAATGDFATVADVARRGITTKLEAARSLLLAVCFISTDHVQHHFFHSRSVASCDDRRIEDLLLHTWRLVDREIGWIVDELVGPRSTVMLVSDHGAGPTEGGVNLGRWLAEGGWLQSQPPGLRAGLRRSALRMGSRLLPAAVRERLRGQLVDTRRRMISQLLAEGVDWPRTSASCRSDYGSISLNRADRFDAGCVRADEGEEIVAEIAERLMALRDPVTSERVMSAALRPE